MRDQGPAEGRSRGSLRGAKGSGPAGTKRVRGSASTGPGHIHEDDGQGTRARDGAGAVGARAAVHAKIRVHSHTRGVREAHTGLHQR